jgi:hypothetical protein
MRHLKPSPAVAHKPSSAFTLTVDQENRAEMNLAFDESVESYQRRLVVNPPWYKRRGLDADVKFDEWVYVRTERNVDKLFWPAAG